MKDRFEAAPTFAQMLAAAEKNVELWSSIRARAAVDDDIVRRTEQLGGRWHLLVLSADWCLDSLSIVPVLDALAARASNVDLRVLDRDANLDLMDAHLSTTGKRAIPAVIAYDEQFEERGMWSSRPQALQQFLDAEGASLPKDELVKAKRRWYAHDRGRSTAEEVVAMLEHAAAQTAHS